MPRLLSIPLLAACLLTSPLLGGTAGAVSVDELFNLKANGLSDDVLVALIEADGSVFHLSSDDVLALHKRGLGERVILAMLASARRAVLVTDPQPAPEPPVRIVPVAEAHAAPAVAPIQQSIVQHVEVVREDPVYVHVPIAIPVAVPVRHEKPVKPVYWGYGGDLRPGSWRPAPEVHPKPIDREHPKSPR
jgi:hypothetical protein